MRPRGALGGAGSPGLELGRGGAEAPVLADPQETSTADLVWDTGSGCRERGTSRLSWLPDQVEGPSGIAPTSVPGGPLIGAENENESAQLVPLPPAYSRRTAVWQGQGQPDWLVRS